MSCFGLQASAFILAAQACEVATVAVQDDAIEVQTPSGPLLAYASAPQEAAPADSSAQSALRSARERSTSFVDPV